MNVVLQPEHRIKSVINISWCSDRPHPSSTNAGEPLQAEHKNITTLTKRSFLYRIKHCF